MKTIAGQSTSKSKIKLKQTRVFDAQAFLDSAGVSRRIVEYKKSHKVYSQGDPAENILYIQNGEIKLSVVNEVGKEAVVAILVPGNFFGEGCLAGQNFRIGTATAIFARDAKLLIIHADDVGMTHIRAVYSAVC